jgi:hypothetical protein
MASEKGYVSHEEYLKLKENTVKQSYRDRHKLTDKGLWLFSWFGNIVSVFLSYFFVKSLFNSAFSDISDFLIISIAIILFLSMYELLKRHVFGLFSTELIRNKFGLFKSNMFTFNLSVLILVAGSFYLSMNGAQRFMNNEQVIITKTETNLTTQIDSLNNFYFNTFIKPLQSENTSLTNQNDGFLEAAKTAYASRYTKLIEQNNNKIKDNNIRIEKYEKERDQKIEIIKNEQNIKLSSMKEENSSNMLIFILISFCIETVIIIGIYFDKYYNYRIVTEYEQEILSKPAYKKWVVYNNLIDVVFEGIQVGDNLPSANDIKDIIIMNEIQATPKELENFFKMMYYFKVIEKRGSKRIMNLSSDKAKELVKKYYKID